MATLAETLREFEATIAASSECEAAISYDMPWNPQRVLQRNGRVPP